MGERLTLSGYYKLFTRGTGLYVACNTRLGCLWTHIRGYRVMKEMWIMETRE